MGVPPPGPSRGLACRIAHGALSSCAYRSHAPLSPAPWEERAGRASNRFLIAAAPPHPLSLLLPPPGRAGPSGASPKRAPSPSLFGPDPADGGEQRAGPRRCRLAMPLQVTPGIRDSGSRARPGSFAAPLDRERTPGAHDVRKKSRVLIYGDDVINKGEVCVQVVSYGRAAT